MPVLVTQADTGLGPALVERLLREGGEVRAFCTGPGARAPLRQAGAIIAGGSLDDEGHLEAAMEQVHTVIDLSGGPLARSAAVITGSAATVLNAASRAGVRRLIRLSVPGAAVGSDDPLRAAEGEVEASWKTASLPTVVVRRSLVDGPLLRDALTTVAGPERGDVPVAPLRAADLVEALAVLDAVRSEAHTGHVVFKAEGATMPLAGYLEHLGDRSRVGRRYVAASEVPLLGPSLEHPWVTEDPEVFDVWEFTGHRPGPLGLPV